jgi:hypothetical protein
VAGDGLATGLDGNVFEGLFAEHGAPIAFHDGIVRGEQLSGDRGQADSM